MAFGRPTLVAGRAHLSLAPELGGSILRYWWQESGEVIDWLRPAHPGADVPNPLDTACFPLVPFSNRIRDGHFRFRNHSIRLPRNFGDHPHAIHGHGWQAPWRLADWAGSEALLEYRHEAGAWPWSYLARQRFSLDEDGLTIALELENTSPSEMPAGLGLHPYFPRTEGATMQADVDAMWQVDHEVMPLCRTEPSGATRSFSASSMSLASASTRVA